MVAVAQKTNTQSSKQTNKEANKKTTTELWYYIHKVYFSAVSKSNKYISDVLYELIGFECTQCRHCNA